MRKKIIVRGPVLSQSGYGEQSRFAIRCLREHEDEFDIHIIPVGWGQTGWIAGDTEERRWLDFIINKTNHAIQNKVNFDVSLQITIPNEWEKLAPINVGYTAGIESDKIDPSWIQKAEIMDKIIVISNHAKYGFDTTSWFGTDQNGQKMKLKNNVPVEAVNYCVRKWEPTKLDLDITTKFNFLAISQWGPRKNLINTVKWFVEECYDQDVGLVLKTNIRNNSVTDRLHTEKTIEKALRAHPDRKCKVYLLHGDMTESELAGLYTHPKIKSFINLSHGEGFGLPIFEAACHGMPVITTDWGGQCDFLYAPHRNKSKAMFSKVEYTIAKIQDFAVWEGVLHADSNWCYPEPASFKKQLRETMKEYRKKKKMATTLQKYLLEEFAGEKQYKKFADAILEVCGQEESNVVKVFG
jgi:glycosyltransferase involved in cell wall biosynthesis